MAENNAAHIAGRGFHAGVTQLVHFIRNVLGQFVSDLQSPWRAVEPVERQTKTVSTIEEPVPRMWIEPPISAGQGMRGTGQPGIQDRHRDRLIGRQLVVVVGEGERGPGFRRPRHVGVDAPRPSVKWSRPACPR